MEQKFDSDIKYLYIVEKFMKIYHIIISQDQQDLCFAILNK